MSKEKFVPTGKGEIADENDRALRIYVIPATMQMKKNKIEDRKE